MSMLVGISAEVGSSSKECVFFVGTPCWTKAACAKKTSLKYEEVMNSLVLEKQSRVPGKALIAVLKNAGASIEAAKGSPRPPKREGSLACSKARTSGVDPKAAICA